MIDLDINKQKLEIMGVPFVNKAEYDATLSLLANNMYEGFQPTIEDIQMMAAGTMPDNARDILEMLHARK